MVLVSGFEVFLLVAELAREELLHDFEVGRHGEVDVGVETSDRPVHGQRSVPSQLTDIFVPLKPNYAFHTF